jgi:hypothetical protein
MFLLLGFAACGEVPTDLSNPLGERPPREVAPAPDVSPMVSLDGTGTATFTQVINSGTGFGQYRGMDQDFGWLHTFPHWNTEGVTITSAKLHIYAYDVDSEPFHGMNGEYDAVYVDGVRLDPGFLQGANNVWSTTTFDVPVSAILDDGRINVWLDIDIYRRGWLTTVGSSTLVIAYTTGPVNAPPFAPTIVGTPSGVAYVNQDLSIAVTGPDPADPDGDAVTYEYRWFIDIGSGGFLDPEIHGRGSFTGSVVPSSATVIGDTWRVQVTPRDAHGAIGPYTVHTFPRVVQVADATPPVITPTVDGTLGDNGWYTSDVAITWSVTDPESPITATSGCEPASVTADVAEASFTCTATSTGGTASVTVTVKRDATPPMIFPKLQGVMGKDGWFISEVTVGWDEHDSVSGIAVYCGQTTLTEDTPGTEVSCAAVNGAGLVSNGVVSVKVDRTPPKLVGTATGLPGDNGWFTGDVAVTFIATDDVSGVGSTAGCAAAVTEDTAGRTFECEVENGAGLKAFASVLVKRDATLPVVLLHGLGNYRVDQEVSVTCTISDALSGLAAQECNGASGPGWAFPLGGNPVSASARDLAGNTNAVAGTFTIEVTHASLCTLVRTWVSQRGVANSLCQKLEQSASARARGNTSAARSQLQAFINEVTAQAGVNVPADRAPTLIALARALM